MKILATSAYSKNTRICYATQYRQFVQWCEERGTWSDVAPAYPPEAVCAYLEAKSERWCSATLHIIPSAIRAHCRDAGLPDPTGHTSVLLMRRAVRKMRNGDRRHATGLTRQHMRKIAPIAKPKQWALLCLMRDCLLRRSEAAAARWRDFEREPDGTGRLTVPVSKTDQEADGAVLFVTKKTTKALLAIRPDFPRPGEKIFGWHASTICRIIKRLASRADLQGDFSGHSLRIGMAQDLARLGASLPQIQEAGRWKDPKMPADYIRSIHSGHTAVAKLEEFLVVTRTTGDNESAPRPPRPGSPPRQNPHLGHRTKRRKS